MSDAICADCERAERELWPVYTQTAWCCRARMIVDATTSRSGEGVTLAQARRSLAERERQMHPATWEAVRLRMIALAAAKEC